MKTNYLFMILMITLIGIQSRTKAQVDKNQAIGMVRSSLTSEELQNWNVLVLPGLFQGRDFYLSPYHVLHSEYDMSWLFFIDMYPQAQWDHNCKYIFVDQQTGSYITINYRIPPQDYWFGWEYVNDPHPYPITNPLFDSIQSVSNIVNPDPHKYAVFLCWNEEEVYRWNNLSQLYCAVKRNYGFLDENIFVLSGNGNYDSLPSYNLDNFGNEQDFDGPCTKDSIEGVFNYLSQVVTNKDILFVYTTSHGEKRGQDTSYLRLWNYDSLFDYELADMLDEIQCSQKIIGIDACYSGGFVDDLENDHSTVQTCVSGDNVSWDNPGLGFGEMSFWWGTALRGYYPESKFKPWKNWKKIGENDSLFVFSDIDSTDFNPDDTLGGNHDDFIQFQEAFNFAYRYASDIRDRDGQNYINEGFQGDLLTLSGIEGRVDTTQEISGNFLIGRKLTLAPEVVLSDFSNVQHPLNLFLNDSTEILVEDSATLNINGYYTKFIGCTGQSFVNIEGDISATYMNFEADTGATININFNNTSKSYILSGFNFTNAGIQASCNSLKFSLTDFDHTLLDFSGGRLELNQSTLLSGSDLEFTGNYLKITNNNEIDNSNLFIYSGTDTINESNDISNADIEFSGDELYIFGPNNITNSALDLANGNINIEDGNSFVNSSIAVDEPLDEAAFVDIIDNSFDNDSTLTANAVVTIEDYLNFRIDSNDLAYASGRGIELFYAGWDGRGIQSLEDNTVHFDGTASAQIAELGMHSYFSYAQISNNQITNNDYGLTGFHGSDLTVTGNSQAPNNDATQVIADNTFSQCLFNYSSFPTEFIYNVIRDNTSSTNPYIQAVEYDEMINDTNQNREIRDIQYFIVEYNCWVDDQDPSDRLLPLEHYKWRPAWCPGESMMKSEDVVETMFYAAKAEIETENYQAADSGFKQIIAGFPESRFALASLKELFALNPALYDSDYSVLKAYCDSLSINPGDSLLGKTAEWLSIHCNIRDAYYQQAINSLDSIIANPGTQADSVFALVDLSYVFMQNNSDTGMKSVLITRHPEIIPESKNQFTRQRKEWIDILLKPKGGSSLGLEEQPIQPAELHSGRIESIRPNPASGAFTVDYYTDKPGMVRLTIISPTGTIISESAFNAETEGLNQKTISNHSLAPGIYYLLLSVEKEKPDAKKLVIIN